MKKIILAIVLLSGSHYATADTSLLFKDLTNTKNEQLTSYLIKDHQLKFSESGQQRINIYDQKKQQFISFDPDSGKSSMFNEDILKQRVRQLDKQRMKKLTQVEQQLNQKLKTMTAAEKEVGESLINVLKYPDMYGEHTLLKIKKADQQKQINNFSCQLYQLYRSTQLLTDFCMADASSLKMHPQDYQTLRSFYAFNYAMQTRLMLAMGQTRFRIINYDVQKIPGILIESINYQGKQITEHLILKSADNKSIEDSEFTISPRK